MEAGVWRIDQGLAFPYIRASEFIARGHSGREPF